jgi:hypothetical protein
MKRTIRIAVLMGGLVGTFIAAAVQQVPAADGGPLLLCPPRQANCKTTPALPVEPRRDATTRLPNKLP